MNDLSVTEWVERDEPGRIADKIIEQSVLPTDELTAYPKGGHYVREVGRYASPDIVLSMRLTYAAYTMNALVEIDADRVQGVPVLKGTRFTIARIVAELADGMTVTTLARRYDLDKGHLIDVLQGISIMLDRPFST